VTYASCFADEALLVPLAHVGKLFVFTIQSFLAKLADWVRTYFDGRGGRLGFLGEATTRNGKMNSQLLRCI